MTTVRLKLLVRQFAPLAVVVVLTTLLRLTFLAYSDYQGDEIKALFLPDPDQDAMSFFLDQRKGPTQFLVTLLIKQIDPGYTNHFLVRLPFALAGILSVVVFYLLIGHLFNKKLAFLASFFFATNGFFVAFSRIAQYQTFVIFFMLLALHLLWLAAKSPKWAVGGIYLGLVSWALSLLSHYDGVFIAPMAFYLLFLWFKFAPLKKKEKIVHFFAAGVVAATLCLAFYYPFLLTLTNATKDYWAGRLSGEVSSKVSSSRYLFAVYQPIYVIHIYSLLSVVAVAFFSASLVFKKLPKISNRVTFLIVFLWFAVPFIFMEAVVSIPGTHIYTYLLPMFVFLAFAITYFFDCVRAFLRKSAFLYLFAVPLTLVLAFIAAQSWAVFVDHAGDYPWDAEEFLIWQLPKPNAVFHLSMFGFPYFRNWSAIKAYFASHPEVTAYSTNERKSISRYFISLPKDSDRAGYYINITSPQSFTEWPSSEKVLYWMSKYPPVFKYEQNGKVKTAVYLMPVGTYAQIKAAGY